MVNLTLDTSILVDALREYRRSHGRGSLAELHDRSGVFNLGRFSTGKMKPTLETWLQLHLSSPDVIPPPTTVNGGVITLDGEGQDIPGSEDHAVKKTPIKGEEHLWELYSRHRSEAVVKTMVTVLEKIDRALEKAV